MLRCGLQPSAVAEFTGQRTRAPEDRQQARRLAGLVSRVHGVLQQEISPESIAPEAFKVHEHPLN